MRWRNGSDPITRLRNKEQSLHERTGILQFQLKEIDAVAPQPGEDEIIQQELKRAQHVEDYSRSRRSSGRCSTTASTRERPALAGAPVAGGGDPGNFDGARSRIGWRKPAARPSLSTTFPCFSGITAGSWSSIPQSLNENARDCLPSAG